MVDLAGDLGVGAMIWEAEPLAATVMGLQERGVDSLIFDPVANRPSAGDLMSVMSANAEALAAAYR